MNDRASTTTAAAIKELPPPSPAVGATIVVVGGGIAGISCIEALFQDYDQFNPQFRRIVLISEDRVVKRVTNYEVSGRQLEKFDVIETGIDDLNSTTPQGLRFSFIVGSVKHIKTDEKILVYSIKKSEELQSLPYDILCICNGSKPKQLEDCLPGTENKCEEQVQKRVIVIRDTSTVCEFKRKLSSCKRIVIVGNGGISLELVTKIANCEKVWIIRDESVGLSFFDPGAAKFLLDASARDEDGLLPINESSRVSFSSIVSAKDYLKATRKANNDSLDKSSYGPSLGPNWSQNLELTGGCLSSHKLDVIYQDEVADVIYIGSEMQYQLRVITRNKKIEIDCDLVALAIGVTPNSLEVIGHQLEVSEIDGGIMIDSQMRTSVSQIYAAGDVVSCEKWPPSELWFQRRLWTQARKMGHYAGRCITAHILNQDPSIYSNFHCFTHCTSFFGFKLVLLGRYNGQSTDQLSNSNECDNFEVIARVNPGRDYVKILVGSDGRILGAVLVGDSGLEETIENLIYDGIDVSSYKEKLLDGTVDIEDYFD